MFGGFGSIQGMIISLRNNKALIKKNSRFNQSKSFFDIKTEYKNASEGIVELTKATPKQLNAIRQKLLHQRKKKVRKLVIGYAIATPFLILFLILTVKVASEFWKMTPGYAKEEKVDTYQAKKSLFDFYTQEGTNWIKKNKWHNATFQFKKAVELFPSDFEANYRLAISYSYQCKYDKKNCEEGAIFIANLKNKLENPSEIKKVNSLAIHWDAINPVP